MTLISPTLRNVCNHTLRRVASLRTRGHITSAPFGPFSAPAASASQSNSVSRSEPLVSAYQVGNRRLARMATSTVPAAAAALGTAADGAVIAADLAAAAAPAPAAVVASSAAAAGNGPSEQPSGVASEAALLASFSEVPTISRAVVRGGAAAGGVTLTVTLQQRNLPANAQRRYAITAALPAGAAAAAAEGDPTAPVSALVGLPQELQADVQLVSVSPSGRQQLVVLKGTNDATAALLQVWRGARMVMELAVPKTLHGLLVNDGYFATGAAWSADESALVYTAEAPALERTPAWGGPEALKDSAGPRSWRGVGAAVEDWGELNTGKRPPAPYVLDLERREVIKVPGLPAEHSVGQPAWCPPQPAASVTHGSDGAAVATDTTTTTTGGGPNGLVFVAWPHAAPPSFPRLAASVKSRKLGVVFCYNRSAHLYHVAVQRGADGVLHFGSSSSRLAGSLDSCLSPTFSPGGDALLFVSHSEAVEMGTHGGTGRLYRLDWLPQDGAPAAGPSAEPQLLVDVVERPAGPSAFPGLYTTAIPDDGFVGPSTLLINTQWGAVNAIVAVGTEAGGDGGVAAAAPVALTPVQPGDTLYGNWTLVGVAGGLAVASRVAPDTPAELYVARLPEDPAALRVAGGGGGGCCSTLVWRPVELGSPPGHGSGSGLRGELPTAVQEALDKLEFRVLRVPPDSGDDSSDPLDCLLWLPRDRVGPLPAVLSPHGGPHTAVTLGWYPSFAALAALGYAVLCPNFRGSTGYGQAALCSLPGRIGRQDVSDCMAALRAAVEAGLVDPDRVSVVGGSHGGFLTAHLLGQHPRMFRSGVMRNPVTNIAAMVAATDIPDWCFVEVLGSEEGRRRASPVPTPEDLAAMYGASPVSYVDRVTAPVFLMLGARDRRVPPLDGLQYLTALRGRDVAVAGSPPPPTRLIVFPEDSHGLDKPQTEFEQWINVIWWLKNHAGDATAEEPAAEGN